MSDIELFPVEAGTARPAGLSGRISAAVMRAEAALAALLVAAIFLLMLASALFRGLRQPLAQADELAVHLMVCLAFLGASLAVALKGHMTMGLLSDHLGARGRLRLALVNDLLILAFLIVMALVIWRWLDLPGLIRTGSGAALAQESFNFAWTDPTQTLGLRKIWFWLVMPLTCLTAMIHIFAWILADLSALKSHPAGRDPEGRA